MGEYVAVAFAALSGGIGAYAAIRGNLAALMARMANVEKSTDQAHARIDTLFQGHRK